MKNLPLDDDHVMTVLTPPESEKIKVNLGGGLQVKAFGFAKVVIRNKKARTRYVYGVSFKPTLEPSKIVLGKSVFSPAVEKAEKFIEECWEQGSIDLDNWVKVD